MTRKPTAFNLDEVRFEPEDIYPNAIDEALPAVASQAGGVRSRRNGRRWLGVLVAASERGLLELPEALDRLMATNFHVSSRLVRLLLDRDSRRLKSDGRT